MRSAEQDSEYLARTVGDEVSNALAVFLCDPFLRELLERVDPQAVKQAREALGLPSIEVNLGS